MAQTFNDNENQGSVRAKLNANADEINAMGKMYAAFITQSSTDAPEYQINLNNTVRTWVSSRVSAGNFKLTADIAFDVTKIEIIIGNQKQGIDYTYYAQSTTQIVIRSFDGTDFVDSGINNTTIKITIYP